MINKCKAIALIPARGGSKGIHKKNIRSVNGLPMLDYTLKAASDSKFIDEFYLTSDDDEILSRGKIYNAKIIRRPQQFSTDMSTAIDVVDHFLTEIFKEELDKKIYIVYLQPTSPLRTGQHIDQAIQQMEKHKFEALVSVAELNKSPYKSFKINTNGAIESLFDEKLSNQGRQQLPKTYTPNGAIYIFKIDQFLSRKGFPSNGSYPYIMSQVDSIDVDTEDDLALVENYLRSTYG